MCHVLSHEPRYLVRFATGMPMQNTRYIGFVLLCVRQAVSLPCTILIVRKVVLNGLHNFCGPDRVPVHL